MTDQWVSDHLRRDGVRIERNPDDSDAWIVLAVGGQSIDQCPCCGKTLPNLRAARLVADLVYPLRDS